MDYNISSATWAGELAADIISGSESYAGYCTAAMWAGCCGSAGELMVIGLGILGNVEAEFKCGGRWTFVHPLFSVLCISRPLPTLRTRSIQPVRHD